MSAESAEEKSGGGNTRWIMGLVGAVTVGAMMGWYGLVNSDLREIRPDVAVLKVQLAHLNEKVTETNQKLAELSRVIERLRLDENRREERR